MQQHWKSFSGRKQGMGCARFDQVRLIAQFDRLLQVALDAQLPESVQDSHLWPHPQSHRRVDDGEAQRPSPPEGAAPCTLRWWPDRQIWISISKGKKRSALAKAKGDQLRVLTVPSVIEVWSKV